MQEDISRAIEYGDFKSISQLVQDELSCGTDPLAILSVMRSAITHVGEHFQSGCICVSEMIVSALAMKRAIDLLMPHLRQADGIRTCPCGKLIVGSAQGDLHDIGKNLLAAYAGANGLTVIDLGVDVTPTKYVDAIRNNPDCRFVSISCMTDSSVPYVKKVVQSVSSAGLRDQVMIFVGGESISHSYAKKIGADIYTDDAIAAVHKIIEILDCDTQD